MFSREKGEKTGKKCTDKKIKISVLTIFSIHKIIDKIEYLFPKT